MVSKSLQGPYYNHHFYESSHHILSTCRVKDLHQEWKKSMSKQDHDDSKNKNIGTKTKVTKPFIQQKGSDSNIKGIDTTATSSTDILDSSQRDSQSNNSFQSPSSWSSLSNSHSNLCSNPSMNMNSYYDNISFLLEQQELSIRKFGVLSRKEIESISQSNSLPRSRRGINKNGNKGKRTCSRPTRVNTLDSSSIEHIVHSFIDDELTIADDRLKRMITKKINRAVENALKKFEMQLRIKTSESHMDEIELELV
ncbi:predicted protein [Chaetoceros tenuissimus]|uniref:Uncharacterized protein n=1 Tax=Chaetoceros tenuissimus TaxID=426638 RepID=A0AAD3D1R2_9STRA|nr:predicted protein [Chaetoceros tenuissimus]